MQAVLLVVSSCLTILLPEGAASTDIILGVFTALALLTQILFASVLVFCANDKKTRPIQRVLRESVLLRLPALVALAILISLAVTVASLAFLVPGIILYVFWSMAFYILSLEETTVATALRQSVALVRGWWWPLFSRNLFVLTLVSLLSIVSIVPGLGHIVASFLAFVLAPILVLYFYLTYEELTDVKRYKHLQTAQVTLVDKVVLLAWGALAGVVFLFASATAGLVNEVMNDSIISSIGQSATTNDYTMFVDDQGNVRTLTPSP